MTKSRYTKALFFFSSISIMCLSICCYWRREFRLEPFGQEMAKIMNLKLVTRAGELRGQFPKIFNDTLVLVNKDFDHIPSMPSFYVKELKANGKGVKIYSDSLKRYTNIEIQDYKHSEIFFNSIGGNNLYTISKNGRVKKHFAEFGELLFYNNKAMISKSLAVLTSMNGVYVFNLNDDRLIWKYHYKDFLDDGMSTVFKDKLIFTENVSDSSKFYSKVICFDLKSSKVIWTHLFKKQNIWEYEVENERPHHDLYMNDQFVAIPMKDKLRFLNVHTGKEEQALNWKNYFNSESYGAKPAFFLDNNKIYVQDFIKNSILKYDLVSGKQIWKVNNACFIAAFREFVIATTVDYRYCFVIRKSDGKILGKVEKPDDKLSYVSVLGKYILLGFQDLYH